MSARVQDLRNRVGDGLDRWHIHVTWPYITAYTDAFDGYTKTIAAQAEADKARAELFVSVASIVTGSILMATVAQTSFRIIAGNAALNFVCDRNLVRTFNAMAVAAENKTLMFALGKTLDGIKDKIGTEIKTDLTKALQAGTDIKSSNPLIKHIELESLLTKHKLAAIEAAERIDGEKSLPEATKAKAFAALLAAPICKPPTSSVDSNMLSKKIELCFYLKAVLDSDQLLDWPAYYGGERRMPTARPIPQLPSAPDYPRPKPPTTGAGQTVGVERLAGVIRDRIDELHNAVFHRPFFNKSGFLMFGDVSGPEKLAEVARAETQIDALAQQVRPLSTMEVRS